MGRRWIMMGRTVKGRHDGEKVRRSKVWKVKRK